MSYTIPKPLALCEGFRCQPKDQGNDGNLREIVGSGQKKVAAKGFFQWCKAIENVEKLQKTNTERQ